MPRQVQVIVPSTAQPPSFDMATLEQYLRQEMDVIGLVKIQGRYTKFFLSDHWSQF